MSFRGIQKLKVRL